MPHFFIDSDIRKANTLPAKFYRRTKWFEASANQIFARTWQYVGDRADLATPGQVIPFNHLPGLLDEPLLLTKDRDHQIHCLSNVCTHRAKLVIEEPGVHRLLSCGYHGRCFSLDGKFRSMPEFGETVNFPSKSDHLHQISLSEWMGMLFISFDPKASLEEMTQPIRERLFWLSFGDMEFRADESKDYEVDAHWALYCDNYLEGFHIPFVHPALNQALDYDQYEYECYDYCNLQLSITEDENEPYFDIPEGAQDYGRKVYAYYYWLFPNLMFNVYPWGVSLNIVQPLSKRKTLVRFRSYYFKDTSHKQLFDRIDLTEIEDEKVVESAQKGVQSRFYRKGRFSPSMEQGVHHFHRLIADYME